MRSSSNVGSAERTWGYSLGTKTVKFSFSTSSLQRADIVPSDGVSANAYYATAIDSIPAIGEFNYSREIWTTVNNIWQWKAIDESAAPRFHRGYIHNAPAATVPDDPASLRGEASSKLRVALKDQKINLAVAYAFRKETASTIVDLCNRLVLGARAFRKKDRKLLGQALRGRGNSKTNVQTASDWWLAYWFGIIPIVNDINGLLGSIAEAPSPPTFKVSGHAKRQITPETVTGSVAAPDFTEQSGEGYHYMREYTTSGYISCRAHATIRIDDEWVRDKARKGIFNPAVVAFDLAKYSFVLGWVVSIGEFLEGLDAGLGVSVITGCFSEHKVTEQISTRSSHTRVYQTNGIYYRCKSVGSATGGYREKKFVRTPFTVLPTASLYLKNPLNGWVAVTAAALIRSAVQERDNWSRKPPEFRYKQPRVRNLPPIKYTRP